MGFGRSRCDLLSFVEAALTKAWPKREVFVVVLGHDIQKSRTRSAYAAWTPLEAGVDVPIV